jgi:hypothetical protein
MVEVNGQRWGFPKTESVYTQDVFRYSGPSNEQRTGKEEVVVSQRIIREVSCLSSNQLHKHSTCICACTVVYLLF